MLFWRIICQLALLIPALGSLRAVVRTAAFGGSLFCLFALRNAAFTRHPSSPAAVVSLIIVGLSFFHPTTNSALAGLAQAALYLAVLSPLFWVPRVEVDAATLRRMFIILWVFHTTSALFGMLQVYFPGQFDMTTSTALADEYLDSLQITLSSGEKVFRPMGLTDTPGGAAMAGFYTVLIGIGLLLERPKLWFRALLTGSIGIGMFALYLCQVRSLIVMLGVCILIMAVLLTIRGNFDRFLTIAGAVVAVVVASFYLAVDVAGEAVTRRLSTLTESNSGEVYYRNRGIFLEHTINDLLPQYPLGAGLGRYGMMMAYFGDYTVRDRGPIYVEIQWTGWLLDGGIPLILAYLFAILTTIYVALKTSLRRLAAGSDSGVWIWALILTGHNVGVLAMTCNYPLFMGTMGLEFWLINAAFFVAASHEARRPSF